MKLVKNHIHKRKESRTNEQREVALSAKCSCAVELAATGGHQHQTRSSSQVWAAVGKDIKSPECG